MLVEALFLDLWCWSRELSFALSVSMLPEHGIREASNLFGPAAASWRYLAPDCVVYLTPEHPHLLHLS